MFFCQEFGVPERLTMDGAKEQIGSNSEFMHQIWKNIIDFHVIEPEWHNQNPAEGVIREAGEALRVFCQELGVPERLTMDGAKE